MESNNFRVPSALPTSDPKRIERLITLHAFLRLSSTSVSNEMNDTNVIKEIVMLMKFEFFYFSIAVIA